MSLDIFTTDQREAEGFAARNFARQLPTTFSEAFETSWREGLYFGQSIAERNARNAAITEYLDEVSRRTGHRVSAPDVDTLSDMGGAPPDRLAAINDEIGRVAAARPDVQLDPLTEEEIGRRAQLISKAARRDAIEPRESTWGGTFGGILGSVATGVTDPINLLTMPLGAPAGIGILRTALAWGAIAGGSQAAIEVAGSDFREQVQPGYRASGEPLANIGAATGFGVALGGGVKALAAAWSRAKTATWPRTIRDAGNVVESEAQLERTNPFGGTGGEVTHREAVSKAIDDLLNDRPVVIDHLMSDEIERAYDFTPLSEARERALESLRRADADRLTVGRAAQADMFFETPAMAEAQGHLGDMAFEIQRIARRAGHDMRRQTADLLAEKIARLPDDEARGVLDELMLRPSTIAEVFPERAATGKAAPAPSAYERAALEELAPDLTPTRQRDIRSAPETADAVATDVARMRADKPDVQVPVSETLGADGKPVAVFRTADDIAAEFEARMTASQEIELCARAAA